MKYIEISAIYNGSDGDATKALYAKLESLGTRGVLALNLFRAMKCSSRAKVYCGGNRSGSFRSQAYARKQWSIDNLCRVLVADDVGIVWGWGRDAEAIGFENVLYVELPTGQVSFHAERRADGPDFPGEWDRVPRAGPDRVCRYVSHVLLAAQIKSVVSFVNGRATAIDVDGRQIPEFTGERYDVLALMRGAGGTGEVEVRESLVSA